jgi:hypothetical protein
MRKIIAVGLCLFLGSSGFCQDSKKSLIVVHVDPASKSQYKQQIFSYHFLNGSFIGRDQIITVTGRVEGKDYIRLDRGKNTLYKGRYLITGMGNIIDLQEKKVLFDGRASLVKCENDSAVFYTNDIFKGKFYSVYNFEKKQYAEVKDLLYKPRFEKDVEFDKTSTPFKINYYPQGAAKVVLTSDAGYGQTTTKDARVADPPTCWLDHSNFVYSHFNKENTELAFYKVNIDSKENKLVGKLTISPEITPAEISRLSDTELLMLLGNKQIIINVKDNSVTDLSYASIGNGFTYECKPSAAGRVVKLNGKEIGKVHFKPVNFVSDKTEAALVKEIMVGTEGYQQGISVWNGTDKKWETVEADEVLRLVGWVSE